MIGAAIEIKKRLIRLIVVKAFKETCRVLLVVTGISRKNVCYQRVYLTLTLNVIATARSYHVFSVAVQNQEV